MKGLRASSDSAFCRAVSACNNNGLGVSDDGSTKIRLENFIAWKFHET